MIQIDLGNFIFLLAMVVGLTLLLITVVLDDVVDGALDALHMSIDVGGVSIAPMALGFVAMFGIGGLFGTTVMDMGSGPASLIGAGAGVVGALMVFAMFNLLARSEADQPYSISDMVGITGRVVVGIPKGRHGEVVVSFAGASQKKAATADVEVKAGETVTVTGFAGTVLIVTPVAKPTAE